MKRSEVIAGFAKIAATPSIAPLARFDALDANVITGAHIARIGRANIVMRISKCLGLLIAAIARLGGSAKKTKQRLPLT